MIQTPTYQQDADKLRSSNQQKPNTSLMDNGEEEWAENVPEGVGNQDPDVAQSPRDVQHKSSQFHIIPRQEGSDLAIALWRLSNHTLRACNEHFIELVEYPSSILAYNFCWPELHKNIEFLADTPVKRILVNSANTLQLLIESIIFGRTKFGKARLAFLSLPGRLKFATIELAAVHDSYNNPIEVLWLMKEADPQTPHQVPAHPLPHTLPQANPRGSYLDNNPQPPFTPLVVSNPSPASPLSAQAMSAASQAGVMSQPHSYSYSQAEMPPQYHMRAEDYLRPAASMPSVLPTEMRSGAQPFPPSRARKNSMPHAGPFQLTEIKTIRKNAAKRPWDQQSAKFSMRPPPQPPLGGTP